VRLVPYPQIPDYQDAVQDPRNTFSDPELKAGRVAVDPFGVPEPMSGGFVLTYKVQTGAKKFAVRCFKREVPQAQTRYAEISTKLQSLRSPCFVDFQFQAEGIRIHGKPYPVVKMDWVEGDTLGVYLDRTSLTRSTFATLRQRFAELSDFLERNGIAHGDIQNDNVMISGNTLRLIDYDGMFVAGMAEGHGSEVGQRHFQHPQRTEALFGPKMDRFSFIVLDVSFQALECDPSLHRRFGEGGQAVIFKANDYADPSSSEVFRVLDGMPAVRDSAKRLAAICELPVASIPSLSYFRSGGILQSQIGHITPRPQEYIGAFPVLDAKDFDAVLLHTGDKIELVGQIESVKEGITRSQGRERPYTHIHFGHKNRRGVKESVRVTIWPDLLNNMSKRPTKAWKGKWVSLTGLVQPVFEGCRSGNRYRNIVVMITSYNQIVEISESEVKFRLGQGPRATKNQVILAGLFNSNAHPQPAVIAPPPKPPTVAASTEPTQNRPPSPLTWTKNQEVLEVLRGASVPIKEAQHAPPKLTLQPSPTPPPKPTLQSSSQARHPGRWLSVVAVVVLVLMLLLLASGHWWLRVQS
jgi:hypothetical protein